jgi:D-3-phosphoglycerate dehydrogenase / 2-oxoglutarate reductase
MISMDKILVSDGLAEEGLALLREAGEVTVASKITADELLDVLPDYHALVVRSRTKVTTTVVGVGSQLRVIGRAGVGVDNIDVSAAVARGIVVVNSPLAATTAVAEHTLGLMLALARQTPAADASMKHQKWEKSAFIGGELKGKALGLIGVGRIVSQVVQLARAFGMSVKAFDPYLKEDQFLSIGVTPASFREILESSDYISLHLPLTAATRGLVGAKELSLLKKNARLICTARGGILDEAALCSALDAGNLAGAALDVFAVEPPGPGSIAEHPKVIATPHIGAQTGEAQKRAGIAIAEEVVAVLEGRNPRWRVTQNE